MYFEPVRVNARGSMSLVVFLILNTIHFTDMANNDMDSDSKEQSGKLSSAVKHIDDTTDCGSTPEECSALNYPCINCSSSVDCIYGQPINYSCIALPGVPCHGPREFNRTDICRFCFQTEPWLHLCVKKANCESVSSPNKFYQTNCTVLDNIVCFGNRKFLKNVKCSWTGGTRWSSSLILAITLGGFGADRFYLGHWQEGIGKLFSFGGLGVWTLIDALLIGIHHLGPADGSLYI